MSTPNARQGLGEGNCLCGAIRYRFALPPLWVAHCHCTMCRRAQGAGFVTWVGTNGERHITLGSVDPLLAAQPQPQAHVHWAERVPWIGAMHDGLPRHEAPGSS